MDVRLGGGRSYNLRSEAINWVKCEAYHTRLGSCLSGTPRTQSGSIVEEQAGAWELRTKAIPGPCISYLSHQRPASDARHSRQGETSHCVAVSGG
jgi:hypothetical protein